MRRAVVHNGSGVLTIHFAHDPRLNGAVKSLPSRWDPIDRCWGTAEANVAAVVALLHPEGFSFCGVTQRLYQERGGVLALDLDGREHVTPPRAVRPGPSSDRRDASVPPKPLGAESDVTVLQLNNQVRGALEAAFPAPIWLVGVICGFNKAADKAGHNGIIGFELVEYDGQGKVIAEIKAILFPREHQQILRRLRAAGEPFRLEDEIHIRVRGRVELRVQWGQYRFVIDSLDHGYTLGAVAQRREESRRRLAEEGLLGQNRSLPFPQLPLRVGLVTSLESDAYHDVLRTLHESGYAFSVVAHGARVQGHYTEPSVLNALDYFRARAAEIDVLLVCRGGGSRTDLAWLDAEPIARAIATFPVPVVIGVGHEKDVSLLDFVARSEKTPTAAAGQLVARMSEASIMLEGSRVKIIDEAQRLIRDKDHDAQKRAGRLALLARSQLSSATGDMNANASILSPRALKHLALEAERIDARARRLVLLDPRRVVERGYAILRASSGKVITDPARAPAGTALTAELKRGALRLRSEGSKNK